MFTEKSSPVKSFNRIFCWWKDMFNLWYDSLAINFDKEKRTGNAEFNINTEDENVKQLANEAIHFYGQFKA